MKPQNETVHPGQTDIYDFLFDESRTHSDKSIPQREPFSFERIYPTYCDKYVVFPSNIEPTVKHERYAFGSLVFVHYLDFEGLAELSKWLENKGEKF